MNPLIDGPQSALYGECVGRIARSLSMHGQYFCTSTHITAVGSHGIFS